MIRLIIELLFYSNNPFSYKGMLSTRLDLLEGCSASGYLAKILSGQSNKCSLSV